MGFFQRAIRIVLTCAFVSAALASANAFAGLSVEQADDLQNKAASGDKTALETLKSEAQRGDKNAQFSVGVLYDNGQGVPQDYREAAQWFRKAAEQGHAPALNNLGTLHVDGQGVPQSRVVAYALYNLAAADNETAAKNRSGLSEGMTNREIEAGQALSREMSKPGNVLKALDQYLAKPAVKEQKRVTAADPPAQQPKDRYPPRPARRPGVVSCNTNCVNGDCYRTYDNGRQVHFQAPLKWNALSGQMEFDAGPCA